MVSVTFTLVRGAKKQVVVVGKRKFFFFQIFFFSIIFPNLFMAAKNILFKSTPKQMSDSWIVIDEQDESDFVVIDNEHQQQSPKPSPQSKRPLAQNNNNKPSNITQPASGVTNNKQHNKKRKWKVLYSLPSTGVQANVNAANLDSYVMDQHAQLFDKRDLFSSQQRIVKVK
jgi:hypothetical protein